MDKFSELKAAAMAATPGPWFSSSVQFNGITTEATFITQGNKPHLASTSEKRDAIFIAAANPAAVLALLAELEAKDDALRVIAFHVSAGGYNADSVDAEVFKQKIIDGINGISDVLVKRIAELEAIATDYAGKFQKAQDALKYAAIMSDEDKKKIAELEAKLATPVRLPRPACTYADHSYPAYSRKQVEEIITSAGMSFTVEGDE